MTLIVCVKCDEGMVMATDSGEVFGLGEPLMRESHRKIEVFNEKYCLAGVGMSGAINRVLGGSGGLNGRCKRLLVMYKMYRKTSRDSAMSIWLQCKERGHEFFA